MVNLDLLQLVGLSFFLLFNGFFILGFIILITLLSVEQLMDTLGLGSIKITDERDSNMLFFMFTLLIISVLIFYGLLLLSYRVELAQQTYSTFGVFASVCTFNIIKIIIAIGVFQTTCLLINRFLENDKSCFKGSKKDCFIVQMEDLSNMSKNYRSVHLEYIFMIAIVIIMNYQMF